MGRRSGRNGQKDQTIKIQRWEPCADDPRNECTMLAQLPKQGYSNTNDRHEESSDAAGIAHHIANLFLRGIPKVDGLRNGARQVPAQPHEGQQLDGPWLHAAKHNTSDPTTAN